MITSRKITLGKLTTHGIIIEPHENTSIAVLLADGNDVELLKKSRTPNTKSADIFMCKLNWEIKAPTGKTIRAIDRIIHRAVHQSQNIIIDTRRTPIKDSVLITTLEKYFRKMPSIRNLWIIDKSQQIIKFKK